MKSPTIPNRTLKLVILATLAAFAPKSWAADPVTQVCGNYANETLAHNTQKQPYCSAAKSAEEAANANGVVWKVYAAASAVCTTACVASMTSFGADWQGWACRGSAIGASGLDAIKTQQYMSALQNIAVGGASYFLFNRTSSSASKTASEASNDGTSASGASQASNGGTSASGGNADISSCITAASTAFSAYTKQQDAANAAQTMKANLANVQALGSMTATGAPLTLSAQGQSQNQPLSNGTALSGNTSVASGNPVNLSPAAAAACGSASSSPGNTQSAIQCAAAMDSALGAVVSNPQFPSAFQKAAGMPLSNYLASAGGAMPNGAIAAGTAGMLNPDGMGKVAGAVASLAPAGAVSGIYDAGGYAGGGPGGTPGIGGGGNDVSAMVSQLLGQFMPKKPGVASQSAATNVKFGTSLLGRDPASASALAEDRSVSLFDRVTSRYFSVTPRLYLSGPQNLALKP